MDAKQTPRLIDIAAKVGVHPSVVSRTLRQDPTLSIRPDTRERIEQTARQMGYRGNAQARALRGASTGAVGMVMPSLRNPVWAEIVRGVLAEAVRWNLAVLVAEVPDDRGNDEEYVRLVEEGRIDGLLLGSSEPAERSSAWPPTQVPSVHVNRAVKDAACNITMDETRAVGLFVDHLTALGHRRITLIDGPATVDTTHRRSVALQRLGEERGLEVQIVNAPYNEQGGHDAMARLLRRAAKQRPTAVGVASLNQALGALAATRTRGVAVPSDLSMICLDDDPILGFLDIQLTAVRMPLFELGEAAMQALGERLSGGNPLSREIEDPIELVGRSSTASVPVR
ncbi:LacI family transcriptional regulator [Kribbella aluminosa]|uniref:LacI family transcriptional regulator n=1 Tax=Kribbella aluminosa TaxID=416017 RepID=A0ABS4UJ29_9ACTN|nr:LacI family DNA-binding transcriptional regulator [Kribbella aluminosa]MBP2351613.1 LacI family transcriptional regulator [Kribbella aluminosa]